MSDDENGPGGLPPIGFDHFLGVEIRTGTVLEAELNPKARVPAYRLRIDFGPRGVKSSSAQITGNYTADELVGRQVVAVLNFEPKRVAGVKSEVLVLGAVSEGRGVVLLEPTFAVENGARIG
jgi:tRNA-binding protein